MKQPTLLITGFDDFGEVAPNASAEVVRLLPATFDGADVNLHAVILPTRFDVAVRQIARRLDAVKPDMCLCLGVAPTPCLRLEQIAINWIDAPGRPDNAGHMIAGAEVVKGAPAAYWSAFRGDRALLGKLHKAELPAVMSISAGTYVCNAVMFAAAHHLARSRRKIPFGFLHIPRHAADIARRSEAEQREIASWPPSLSAQAIRIIVDHWRAGAKLPRIRTA